MVKTRSNNNYPLGPVAPDPPTEASASPNETSAPTDKKSGKEVYILKQRLESIAYTMLTIMYSRSLVLLQQQNVAESVEELGILAGCTMQLQAMLPADTPAVFLPQPPPPLPDYKYLLGVVSCWTDWYGQAIRAIRHPEAAAVAFKYETDHERICQNYALQWLAPPALVVSKPAPSLVPTLPKMQQPPRDANDSKKKTTAFRRFSPTGIDADILRCL